MLPCCDCLNFTIYYIVMDKAIFVIADRAHEKSARDGHWNKIIVYIHEINILPKRAIVLNVMNDECVRDKC